MTMGKYTTTKPKVGHAISFKCVRSMVWRVNEHVYSPRKQKKKDKEMTDIYTTRKHSL